MKKQYLLMMFLACSLVVVFIFLSSGQEIESGGELQTNKTNEAQQALNAKNSAVASETLNNQDDNTLKGSIEKSGNHPNAFEQTMKSPWWYQSPVLENKSEFAPSNTLVELDTSCVNQSFFNAQLSIEEIFENVHSINTKERFPEDLFYFTLTQFWQFDDRYYQFVAIWERDMPALYRFEFYRSKDANFEVGVEAIDLPIALPKSRDVISTNQYISSLTEHYLQQGALLGARILESSINNQDGDEQLTFTNSRLTQWRTSRFSCDSGGDSQSSFCICNSGDNSWESHS